MDVRLEDAPAFSNAKDKDKTAAVKAGKVVVGGIETAVKWIENFTDGSNKTIVSVEDTIGGKVSLSDGTAFENPPSEQDSASHAAEVFILIQSAEGLAIKDFGGLSDPFVSVHVGKQQMKTSTKGQDLNPAWDEHFSFKLGSLDDDVVLEVWDKDSLSADDFLGQVRSFVLLLLAAKPSRQLFEHDLAKMAGAAWISAAPDSRAWQRSCHRFWRRISVRHIHVRHILDRLHTRAVSTR